MREDSRAGVLAPGCGRDAAYPWRIPPRGWADIAARVRHEWGPDHVSLSAAGVAFFAFVAIVPALVVLVSLLGTVTRGRDAESVVTDLFGVLPDSARDLLAEQLAAISSASSGSLSIGVVAGVVLSLWSASAATGQLLAAINVAYDEHETRPWYVRRGLALAVTIGAIVFVAVAVFAVVALPVLISRAGLAPSTERWLRLLIWPALAIGFGIALAVLYRIAPNRRSPRWRWVSAGSLAAVLAWIVLTAGFRVYVSKFSSYNETYGTLSAVVVLLLWLWVTAVIVLVGAEINAESEHQTAIDTTVGEPLPIGQRGALKADRLGSRRRARAGP